MQVNFDFFGPECRWDHALEYNKMAWDWPGSALTASTHTIHFDRLPTIKEARFLVVFWPLNNAWVNLVHMDDGPTNIVGIKQLTHPNTDMTRPRSVAADVTAQLQALAQLGVRKHLGYQLHGYLRIGVVRLEIDFG